MLAAITDMYLTAHVLILLDGSSASRFWPLMEAWCSMQTVTSDGLLHAKEGERRYTIKCIHTATDKHDGEGLVDKVSKKTPDEMFDHLKKPDVDVTNKKDKETMLPKILEIDGHVIKTFGAAVSEKVANSILDIKPDEFGNVISLGIELRTPSEKLLPPMQQ
jgi:hypothetical protein